MKLSALIETDWLEAHLGDSDLRVYDCTTVYSSPDNKRMQFDGGRSAYEEGHIPGAGYIDVFNELSDRSTTLRTMMPPVDQFTEVMSRYGIGDGIHAVLYDNQLNMWATRVWWMLRAMGFDNASVLNGGWHKWTQEARPVSTEESMISPATFVAKPRARMFADKETVLEAINDKDTQIVSALTREMHAGENLDVTRRGHITSSTCVPFSEVLDLETMTYLPIEELRQRFDAAGATEEKHVITYCGTGIAATSDAFALHLVGQENVAVYDGSLEEWSADPNLPMEK